MEGKLLTKVDARKSQSPEAPKAKEKSADRTYHLPFVTMPSPLTMYK